MVSVSRYGEGRFVRNGDERKWKNKRCNKKYNELAGDAEVKRLAEVRLMAQLEENAALASARAKGEEKGMKDGKKQANIEMAKKLLKMKMPIEQIKEITGLSEKEIRKIKEKNGKKDDALFCFFVSKA